MEKVFRSATRGSQDNVEATDSWYNMYEIIEPGTYIAVRTPNWNTFENFFLIHVVSKRTAEDCVKDKHSREIGRNERFIVGNYLEECSDYARLRKLQFRKTKKYGNDEIFIHIGEVSSYFVEIDSNLQMSVEEYSSLCSDM